MTDPDDEPESDIFGVFLIPAPCCGRTIAYRENTLWQCVDCGRFILFRVGEAPRVIPTPQKDES